MPTNDPPKLVLDEVGDVVLIEAAPMLALADAERLALLDQLRRRGPSTIAELSAVSGVPEAVPAAQPHLLAGAGLVTVTPDGEAEGPRWEAVGQGVYFAIPAEPGEAQDAARKLTGVMLLGYADLPRRWVAEAEPRLEIDWCRAAGLFNARVALTPDELRDVQQEIERVLEPYIARDPERVPADGRSVRVLAFFLPEAAQV